MSLKFDTEHRDAVAVIRLTGRIDRDSATELEKAYASAGVTSTIELDFHDVDYINSTGIALIVGLLARARADRVAVRAAGLTPHYQHIFEITRLSDFIDIVQPAGS
jgi:anti-anti-sigma factor